MAPGRRLPCRRRLLHYTRKYAPWQRQLAVMDASAPPVPRRCMRRNGAVNRRSAAKQDSGGLNRSGLVNLRRILHAAGEHPPAPVKEAPLEIP